MEFKQYVSKPKKPWIICPQITIYFIFGGSLFTFIKQFSILMVVGKLYFLFLLILLLFIGIFVHVGIYKENYKIYFNGLILSIIYGISKTIELIVNIILLFALVYNEAKKELIYILYNFIFGLFVYWIITIILLIYLKKLKKMINFSIEYNEHNEQMPEPQQQIVQLDDE
jgi:membrane-associated phospholipid phosphatase